MENRGPGPRDDVVFPLDGEVVATLWPSQARSR